jgi:hypothetical protein
MASIGSTLFLLILAIVLAIQGGVFISSYDCCIGVEGEEGEHTFALALAWISLIVGSLGFLAIIWSASQGLIGSDDDGPQYSDDSSLPPMTMFGGA